MIIDTEIPAVCSNPQCPDYKAFELVDIDSIRKREDGVEVVTCAGCGCDIEVV